MLKCLRQVPFILALCPGILPFSSANHRQVPVIARNTPLIPRNIPLTHNSVCVLTSCVAECPASSSSLLALVILSLGLFSGHVSLLGRTILAATPSDDMCVRQSTLRETRARILTFHISCPVQAPRPESSSSSSVFLSLARSSLAGRPNLCLSGYSGTP